MGIYDIFGTSKELETNGTPLKFGDTTIYVKRAGGHNREYKKTLAEKTREFLKNNGVITADDAEVIIAEVYAETIIAGWDNLTDKSGTIIEYNKENCTKLLLDLPDLVEAIEKVITNISYFQKDEDDIKN